MESKQCKGCGEVKNFDEFYKHIKTLDGYRGKCKICMKKYLKQYRKDNDESFIVVLLIE